MNGEPILHSNEHSEIATEELWLPPHGCIYVLKDKLLLWKCESHIMQNAMESTSPSVEQYTTARFCININKLARYSPLCSAVLFLSCSGKDL